MKTMKPITKETKTFYYFGRFFTIKKISPWDFIEAGGLPFSLFNLTGEGGNDASKNIFKTLKTADEKKKELELQREVVKKVLKCSVVKPYKFKPGSLTWERAFALYAIILDFNLGKIKKVFNIERNNLILIDAMAKRYGKTPVEMISPVKKEYTEIEAIMFNLFVGVHAITHEIEQHNAAVKRQEEAAKVRRK